MEPQQQSLEKRTDDAQERPDHQPEDPRESVEKPAELIRLAHMVQSTLNEVRTIDLDEGGRERLSDIHNRTVTELRGLLSEDLQDELDEVAVTPMEDAPSAGELRIAQAQLVGWLQGLFQGIQASMASQAMIGQQRAEAQPPQAGSMSGGGQYL